MQTFFSSVVADIALRLGRVNKLEIQHETPRFRSKGKLSTKINNKNILNRRYANLPARFAFFSRLTPCGSRLVDEGQQYGTDREIATISLLKQQPLILWTGDAQQTPGGIARTAPNAKRSRQLLLAKKHGLRSDRNYYMPFQPC